MNLKGGLRGQGLAVGISWPLLLVGSVPAQSAWAQNAPQPAPETDPAAVRLQESPRLQVQPQINALPESLHNPTSKEAPSQIHQGDWGVFNRDGGSPAGFGPVARYGTDRSHEDWSYLRNPALTDDVFDPLKFIPLNADKSIYLTLSADERLKNWFENRPSSASRSLPIPVGSPCAASTARICIWATICAPMASW